QAIILVEFIHQWQVSNTGTHLFAHQTIAAELQCRVLALLPKLRIGDPFDRATTVGTLAFEGHMKSVLRYIELGRGEGARVVAGGGPLRVEGFPNALFLEPTVFIDVEPDMIIARQEIFGPVVTLFQWSDEQAMLNSVNALDYGLAAGIWTENLGR